MLDIPDRVNEDQYKALVMHWMSDKAKRQSEKNKQTRGPLQLLHHMGKKSFALLKEIMRKKLGRYPTRAELFEECYYRADGSTTSEAIKEVIVQMKEVDAQAPQNSNVNPTIYDPNDSFAQILGKDKDGQLRMYGLGVTQTDVYGEKPSRATLLRQAMDYKAKFLEAVDKYEKLNEKLETLSAYVHGTQPVGNSDATNASPNRQVNSEDASLTTSNENVASGYVPVITPNGQVDALSPQLTSPNNQRSIGSTSHPMPIRGGSYVVLKSLGNMDEIVATGIVDKMDNVRANGVELGPDFCQVVIQYQVKKDARLIFPQNHIQTIGSALGVPIAWPLSLVALDDEFHC